MLIEMRWNALIFLKILHNNTQTLFNNALKFSKKYIQISFLKNSDFQTLFATDSWDLYRLNVILHLQLTFCNSWAEKTNVRCTIM